MPSRKHTAHDPPSPPALAPPQSPPCLTNSLALDDKPVEQDDHAASLADSLAHDGDGAEGEGEGEYYVDYIVRHKYFPDLLCWRYEVKWLGFGDEHNTWEEAHTLQHLPAWETFLNKPSIKSRISASREDSSEPKTCPTTDAIDLATRLGHLQEPLPIRRCVLKTLEKKQAPSRQLRLERRTNATSPKSGSKTSGRNSSRNLAPDSETSKRTNNKLDSDTASTSSKILPLHSKRTRRRAVDLEDDHHSKLSAGSGSSRKTVDVLRQYLQSFLGPMEDVYLAACQSIHWDDQRVPYLSGSTVVIWGRDSAYSKRSVSESGGGYEFETVALWYCLTRAGAIRAKFGDPNRTYHVLKSVALNKAKPEAVDKVFIHRSHLHQLSRLGGLSELIKQRQHYVEFWAFGSSVCIPDKDIRRILTGGAVIIPTLACVLQGISSDGTNAFSEFIEAQRDNPTSQMYLTLATARQLVHESQNALKDPSGEDGCLQALVARVLDHLREASSGKVTICPAGRRCLSQATFAILQDTPGEQDVKQAWWDEQAEVEQIVKALNDIRQLLHEETRKCVMVVEDDSQWLETASKEVSSVTKTIEVMSISQALAKLKKPGARL